MQYTTVNTIGEDCKIYGKPVQLGNYFRYETEEWCQYPYEVMHIIGRIIYCGRDIVRKTVHMNTTRKDRRHRYPSKELYEWAVREIEEDVMRHFEDILSDGLPIEPIVLNDRYTTIGLDFYYK